MINTTIWEKKYKAPEDTTPEDTFRRVANFIADSSEEAHAFFEEMKNLRFIPGGRILAYAGRGSEKATLSNCFVMGRIEDSMEGIMRALNESALTMKAGGGIGLDFSTLRPYGAEVKGTQSVSSGPVSFMEMWNSMSRTISGVGDRKGAMIAVLRCDHPDIERFINAKRDNSMDHPVLEKFNISVLVTDAFMRAVIDNRAWDLLFNGEVYKTVKARDLWQAIVKSNWRTAEPGVLFYDNINNLNNLYYCEEITASNPCGELPMPPYGACTLGSINLTAFVNDPFGNPAIDWDTLSMTVKRAVRFLDLTVDKNYYPVPEQERVARATRRIGLGVMGLGSMLAMMKLRYGGSEALDLVENLFAFIRESAYGASANLAREKGSFPLFDRERYLGGKYIESLSLYVRKQISEHGMRNSHILTVAPTGSISQLIGNVSSGIEPIFHIRYYRKNYGQAIEVEDYAYRIYRELRGDTEEIPDYFVTAHDLSWKEHIDTMAVIQRYVDSAISKTINVPKDTTVDQLQDVYIHAWRSGLKGCTIYREGSLDEEILSMDRKEKSSIKHFERPYSLEGKTYKVRLPENRHAYYLTFTHRREDGKNRPVELFINSKDPLVEEWVKALGRLTSAVFRNVQDPTFLADEFREIMGKSGFWSSQRRKYVPSLIAEFGEVMRDYFAEIGLIDPEVPIELYSEESTGKDNGDKLAYCRVCGQYAAIFEEGCLKCLACGYNKCG